MKGRNRAWIRKKMEEARETFISLSDPYTRRIRRKTKWVICSSCNARNHFDRYSCTFCGEKL